MRSQTTDRFWQAFHLLPIEIQEKAKQTFIRWQNNPHHKSLRFKQIHSTNSVFSVRIGINYRALGFQENETIIWFWIGSHSEYDSLIDRL